MLIKSQDLESPPPQFFESNSCLGNSGALVEGQGSLLDYSFWTILTAVWQSPSQPASSLGKVGAIADVAGGVMCR